MDSRSVVGWVMVIGLVINVPLVAVAGWPAGVGPGPVAWLALSGACNVGGLLLVYLAFTRGKVGIVAPITSTEGAVAAVIAVLAGESLSGPAAAALALTVIGVVIAARPAAPEPEISPEISPDASPAADIAARTGVGPVTDISRDPTSAVALAVVAALIFGLGLYATGRSGQRLPSVWVALPPRLVGSLVVALPLALRGRLHSPRRAPLLLTLAGVGEVAGFVSYGIGARHGIAIAAVLATQFAALVAIGSFVLFRERLGRLQVVGVATICVGVALLTALTT
jgi:drug/metabolite transporter (DMT)-like permease